MRNVLKQRLEFICEFSKVTPTFINGSIRKLEKTNLTYIEPHRVIINNITFLVFNYSNDVYITNLTKKIKLSELEEYLKENKKADYTIILMDGTLNTHLKEIQETADNRVQQIINDLKSKSDLTEDMKNTDMLHWIGTMNSIKNQAEEIVFSELIYV